jgi:hypothetical protein
MKPTSPASFVAPSISVAQSPFPRWSRFAIASWICAWLPAIAAALLRFNGHTSMAAVRELVAISSVLIFQPAVLLCACASSIRLHVQSPERRLRGRVLSFAAIPVAIIVWIAMVAILPTESY